jgi:hypothetical protein
MAWAATYIAQLGGRPDPSTRVCSPAGGFTGITACTSRTQARKSTRRDCALFSRCAPLAHLIHREVEDEW